MVAARRLRVAMPHRAAGAAVTKYGNHISAEDPSAMKLSAVIAGQYFSNYTARSTTIPLHQERGQTLSDLRVFGFAE